MLRVELGTPRLLWGVHPSSSAMAPVVGLVCGDPNALWVRGIHRFSPPVFSLVPRSHGERGRDEDIPSCRLPG